MRLVTDYLDHIVQEYPEKIAFANEQDSMTFSQVHENARKVAVGLIKENILSSQLSYSWRNHQFVLPPF